MNKRRGISLIVLVITILVMIILAGVVVVSLSKNNPIEKARTARELTNLKAIEEEISLYSTNAFSLGKKGLETLPLKKDSNGNIVTADKYLNDNELAKIPTELREIMYKLQKPLKGKEFLLEDVDFTSFYMLDEKLIPSTKAYNNRFILFSIGEEYILLSLDGIKHSGSINYIALPIGKNIGTEFIATDNNTFMLGVRGDLRAIGQKNDISGQDKDDYSGYKELAYLRAKFPGYRKVKVFCGTAYVIDSQDNLWAWGSGDENRLGQGNSYLQIEPVQLLKGKKVKDVFASTMNTFVVTTDNEIYGAGSNVHGALGQGHTNTCLNFVKINVPFDVTNLINILPSTNRESNNVVYVVANGNEKRIFASGHNYSNIFGGGNIVIPSVVEITNRHPEFKNAEQVSFVGQNIGFRVGTNYYIAGRGGLWGDSPFIETSGEFKIAATNVAVISEYSSTAAYVGTDGYIYACANRYLNANNTSAIHQPFVKASNINIGTSNIQIDSQKRIIKNNNEVYEYKFDQATKTLIANKFNVTNLKNINPSNYKMNIFFTDIGGYLISPYWEVTSPKNRIQLEAKLVKENVRSISAYVNSINILDRDGAIWSSLSNKNNEIKEKVKKIGTDNGVYVALTESGKLYVKGNGRIGGDGTTNKKEKYTQVKYANGTLASNVKDVFVSIDRDPLIFFTTKDNKLYYSGAFWGNRFPNQDIDADTGNVPNKIGDVRINPVRMSSQVLDSIVDKIEDIDITFKLSEGHYYSNLSILTTDGEVYTYGHKNVNGTNLDQTDFVKVNLPGKVKEIKARGLNTIVLLENGEVYAWGYNSNGEFGTGKQIGKFYTTPTKLELYESIVTFELGNGFSIFGTATGNVYGSGKNEYGQLGTGDTISTSNFVECKILEGIYQNKK